MSKALFIVDVQNDFTEGGALGVEAATPSPSGSPASSRHTPTIRDHRRVRDWHDADNDNGGHFHSEPDFVDTWPAHCVSGTEGAEYDPGLDTGGITHHVKKGQGKPAYSLFEGTTDDGVTVAQLLDEHGVIDVDIAGLATDYCVRASALDAIEHGRHVRVLTDLIAGVAPNPAMPPSANSPMRARSSPSPVSDDPALTRGRPGGARGRGIRRRTRQDPKRMTDDGIQVIGVRMGTVFDIAKANTRMPLAEVDRLLDSNVYEMRVVAVSILDFKARVRGLTRRRSQGALRPVDAAARPHRHMGLHRPIRAASGRLVPARQAAGRAVRPRPLAGLVAPARGDHGRVLDHPRRRPRRPARAVRDPRRRPRAPRADERRRGAARDRPGGPRAAGGVPRPTRRDLSAHARRTARSSLVE